MSRFLTIIDLHHTALLADMAVTLPDRTRLEFANSLFNALGTFSLFFSYFVWDRSHLASFRLVCLSLGVASAIGFVLSCYVLARESSQLQLGSSKKIDSGSSNETSQTRLVRVMWPCVALMCWQTIREPLHESYASMLSG